jgi:hypothetical protein
MLAISPSGFQSATDIANRALHHLGADHEITSLITDQSKNQRLIKAVYTKLRQAELRRAPWGFAMRHSILRPLDTTSMAWTAPVYAAGTTYRVGQVASYDDGLGSRLWMSNAPANLGNTPGSAPQSWEDFTGPIVAVPYDAGTTYFGGDLVYISNGDGTYTVYRSLRQGNGEDPATTDAFDATVTYAKDQIVVYNSQNYISLVDLNLNHTPDVSPSQWATTVLSGSLQWVTAGGTLAQLAIVYPLSSGPASQSATRNVFPLPYGFLKKGPQHPGEGQVSPLGAPLYLIHDDWVIEQPYLISGCSTPFAMRYVADVTNVAAMDPMFCEGFAARVALELAEPITQSTAKVQTIGQIYRRFMGEATIVDGIENGSDEPAEDDLIACRL